MVRRTMTPASEDRLLLLAPHPDDESLTVGGTLRRFVRAGAVTRVVFVTDGDNNPWVQRVHERRLWIGPRDRQRFGALRRREALAALDSLGLGDVQACFLGFPDQGLTGLLKSGDRSLVRALVALIEDHRPTVIVGPSSFDQHPDHSALSLSIRLALRRIAPRIPPPLVLEFITHGDRTLADRLPGTSIDLDEADRAAKWQAIREHASQASCHRRLFRSFVKSHESFLVQDDARIGSGLFPIRLAGWGRDHLWIEATPRTTLAAFGRASLCLLSFAPHREPLAFGVDLRWGQRESPIRVNGAETIAGSARLSRRKRGGVVRIPYDVLDAPSELFAKIERRGGFFDEAGWLELATPAGESIQEAGLRQAAGAGPRPSVCAVVPCYNVADLCEPVLREASCYAERVIAVDDGSTDGTWGVLRDLAEEAGGRITVVGLPENRGKGCALLEGFRHALAQSRFDVLVTLDGDGQHRPRDIPRLVHACREGADLVIGARDGRRSMPLRSRVGYDATRALLDRLFPGCPPDSQSGFRALSPRLVREAARLLQGGRYETELQVLLLALVHGHAISTVTIPAIYLDGNRASHFRPVIDSARICRTAFACYLTRPGSWRRPRVATHVPHAWRRMLGRSI